MRRLALGRFATGIKTLSQEERLMRLEEALGEVELASHVGSVGDLPTTLTDPNADKPLFWSDKKKEFKFLNSGTGVTVDTDDDGEGSINLDLEAGTGIAIDGNEISIDLDPGVGIDIDGNEISVEPNLQAINALTFAPDKLITTTDDAPPTAALIDFKVDTYTPTTTDGVNVDSTTPNPTMYLRMGSLVGVFGHILIDPSSGSAPTEVRLSLPVASNFSSAGQCVGTASSNTYGGVQIQGDPATDKAVMNFVAPSGTADDFSFTFWYQII